jgi:hypothetical protein
MYIYFAINCFIKKHRSNNPSCTYSTPDTNFHWMEQGFMDCMCILWTPVAIILCIYVSLEVKPHFIKKNVNCGLISDWRNQMQKWTLLAGLHSCKAWITVILYGLCLCNCVALLARDFSTPVSWARRFSHFLGVCSSLPPMSSNFSSVSTQHLCFCFLSESCYLSLLTKLWIVCLLGTLSSRHLRWNFRPHFLGDPYFM